MPQIILKPIGTVHNRVKTPMRDGWEAVTSEITIDKSLSEHLKGLEEFSHIVVIYWMHRSPSDTPPPARIHPRGRADLPLVGLFSTRSPHRPNSIGMSVVKLVERRDNLLTVAGLDAIDGTPVIDIKPYMPPIDNPSEVRMPDWANKLRT
jgi:tRNA-Thr(GGU) m(6)t(6)A37 methyltransferase TsaA